MGQRFDVSEVMKHSSQQDHQRRRVQKSVPRAIRHWTSLTEVNAFVYDFVAMRTLKKKAPPANLAARFVAQKWTSEGSSQGIVIADLCKESSWTTADP